MQLFDKKSSFLLAMFALPLLFIPKINLIQFGGETAGIRIDDLILICLFFILFWAHFSLRKRLLGIEKYMFFIIGTAIVSFCLNRFFLAFGWINLPAKIFYSTRLLEYFVFFYIGALAALFFRIKTIMNALLIWIFTIMTLQSLGLVGGFYLGRYVPPTLLDRLVGIASFPSEMGAILSILFCLLIYDPQNKNQTVLPYALFLVFTILAMATGSRIAIFSLLVCFLFKMKELVAMRSSVSILLAILFLTICATIAIPFALKTEAIAERSRHLFSLNNIEIIKNIWAQINTSVDYIDYVDIEGDSYDTSWWMRINKWCYVLKIYLTHPECYLQGIGPGFAMTALDGGFLRILVEYGIIGCFLFYKLFAWIAQQSRQMKWAMIAFLINMIFFDVYLAYKVMALLFFASGITPNSQESGEQLRTKDLASAPA